MRNAHTLGKGETIVCGGVAVSALSFGAGPSPVLLVAHGVNDKVELDLHLDGIMAKGAVRYQLKEGHHATWSAVGFARAGVPLVFPLPQAEVGVTTGFPFEWGELNWTVTTGLTTVPDFGEHREWMLIPLSKKNALALCPTVWTGLGVELPAPWEGTHWVLEGGCAFPLPPGPELAFGLKKAF